MISIIYSILSFIVALSVLIAVHEYGHYWMARRMGVKVLRFAIGFGKPLWSAKRGVDKTEYLIGMLPLGGYVKMLDEREGPVPDEEKHRAFNNKGVWARIAIVAAGPVANFLFAIAVYWGIFLVGLPGLKPIVEKIAPASIAENARMVSGDEILEIAGKPTPTLESVRLALVDVALDREVVEVIVSRDGQRHALSLDLSNVNMKMIENGLLSDLGMTPKQPHLHAIIGGMEEGGIAEKAGLKIGDEILEVDQKPISDWFAWADYIRTHPNKKIEVRVKRDGVDHVMAITPAEVTDKRGTHGRIGAAPRVLESVPDELKATQRFGALDALIQGVKKTWETSLLTLRMLWKMVLGEASLENLSGPISIAQYAGQSAQIGLLPFFAFLAIISISLGVLNLLPVPVLDGGHLMFYAVEAVKGSPVSEHVLLLGQKIGIVLLVGLMILAFYNDLARVFG